jgi:hypothetical protein
VRVAGLPAEGDGSRRAAVGSLFVAFALAPVHGATSAHDVDPSAPSAHAAFVGKGAGLRLLHNVYPVLRPENGRPSGEVYVAASSPSEATRAANALEGLTIADRQISAVPATRGELYAALAQMGDRGFSVDGDYEGCVGLRGLAPECTSDDVKASVGVLGPTVEAVFFGRRPDGQPSGEAVVVFATEAAASAALGALALPEATLGGRALAEPPRAAVKAEGYALIGGAHRIRDDADVENVLLISGVPQRMAPEELVTRFAAQGVTVRNVFLHQRPDGKPSGDAYVEFPSAAIADGLAGQMDRIELSGGVSASVGVVPKRALYDAISRPTGWPAPPGSEGQDVLLRCKGVPFETREADVETFFKGFKPVKVHLLTGNGRTVGEWEVVGGGGRGETICPAALHPPPRTDLTLPPSFPPSSQRPLPSSPPSMTRRRPCAGSAGPSTSLATRASSSCTPSTGAR